MKSKALVRLFSAVYAAQPWTGLETAPGSSVADVATIKSLETLLSNVIRAIVALSGVALFVMLLVGGFNFLFSGGDQKKLDSARATITHAVMGLVIIVSAYLLLRTVSIFTGVDVTNFVIPTQ